MLNVTMFPAVAPTTQEIARKLPPKASLLKSYDVSTVASGSIVSIGLRPVISNPAMALASLMLGRSATTLPISNSHALTTSVVLEL